MSEYISEKNNITKKDFTKCFWLGFLMQANFTYAKMQGVGFCIAIQHILRKIWTNDEDYKHALQRHLAPFNMTVAPSPLIMGISIAMEEQAKEDYPDYDYEAINAVKVSLMGPLSGVGDAFFWGIIKLLASGLALGFAQNGNPIAPFVLLAVFNIPNFLTRWYTLKIGYERGQSFLGELEQSGKLQLLTYCAGILGMVSAGCMIAMWCSINCPLTFTVNDAEFVIQDTLDEIFPCLLPLVFVLFGYNLIKKGMSSGKITLILALVGFVLGMLNLVG
ncbi:MAG: PTS system mannose/fructose/sorbose family transporter subunit IID [Erysipelotrichaceae bacterium]|nr:PTS system mannose/fructose/sorbose family transporter subunit IID [Erysipelotrichaceae bacterium]